MCVMLLAWVFVSPLAAQQNRTARTVKGQVVGPNEKPVAEALVHLKNRKTSTVLTVVTDEEGRYEFVGLPLDTDFEVYAEFPELRSPTKRVSSFDRRTRIVHNFELKKSDRNAGPQSGKKPEPAEKESKPNP